MRRKWIAREAAGQRSSSPPSGQGGALSVRGQVAPRNTGVRVFIFHLLVVFVLVAAGVVLFVIRASRAQTSAAVGPTYPDQFVVAEPPVILVVLQIVDPLVIDLSGAVRPSFPVIVRLLLLLLVSQRQFLLAVHQNRAGVQLLSHVVVRQARRRWHEYLATHFDMVVLVVVPEACHHRQFVFHIVRALVSRFSHDSIAPSSLSYIGNRISNRLERVSTRRVR